MQGLSPAGAQGSAPKRCRALSRQATIRRASPRDRYRGKLSKAQRERRLRRLLYASFASVFALAVVILAFTYYREVLTKGSQPAATVEGEPITLDTFAKLYGYRQISLESNIAQLQQFAASQGPGSSNASLISQEIQRMQQQRDQLDQTVLNELIEQRLVAVEAGKLGISVSREEEDARIARDFGSPAPTPGPEGATPVPTPDPFVQMRTALANAKVLNEDDLRAVVIKPTMLSEKLRDAVATEVATVEPQVRARHILLESEDAAKTAAERLGKGESFEQLAKDLSKDTSNKDKAGDLGWFGRGRMTKPFEDVAFELPVGQISQPVQTAFGWHLIEVLEKDQNRALEPSQIQSRRDEDFRSWLEKKKDDAFTRDAIEYEYSMDDLLWAKNKVNKARGLPPQR